MFVSDRAFEGLRSFAETYGVSVTATIDAIGIGMAELGRMPPQRDVVREARRIDADRRDRRPRS